MTTAFLGDDLRVRDVENHPAVGDVVIVLDASFANRADGIVGDVRWGRASA